MAGGVVGYNPERDNLRTIPQSLVSIGQVVSEKKIFNNFLLIFLFLAIVAILVGGWGRRIQS